MNVSAILMMSFGCVVVFGSLSVSVFLALRKAK